MGMVQSEHSFIHPNKIMTAPARSAITLALASTPTISSSIEVSNQPPIKQDFDGLVAPSKFSANIPLTPPNSYTANTTLQSPHPTIRSPLSASLDQDSETQYARVVPLSKEALSARDKEEVITPAMLAKEYLPKIMLGHGDMAIRHVMSCLNHNVPGYSNLSTTDPARARRIVVAALEGKFGANSDGNIQYVKIGWGRWLAHVRGQKPVIRSGRTISKQRTTSLASEDGGYALSHNGSTGSPVRPGMTYANSQNASGMPYVDEALEDLSESEDFADNMSLDGLDGDDDEEAISSHGSEDDETDEEDWKSMGAAALRAKSNASTVHTSSRRKNYNLLCIPSHAINDRRYSSSSSSRPAHSSRISSSAPMRSFLADAQTSPFTINNHPSSPLSLAVSDDEEEREAARALMSLGSL